MRRLFRIVLTGLLLIVALGLGLVMIALYQLADPASVASNKFTAGFTERCVAVSQHADQSQPIDTEGPEDNVTDICRCGADNLREDLADTGVGGLVHMVFIEGVNAKLQRVMDGCQATPSAP